MATYASLKYKIGTQITGEIPTASIADNAITTAKINADAVTAAKIPDNAINSEHYTDGSIDTAHVADDQITLAKMASGTDGNLITYDTSGDPAVVATGSDGQVLTSAGAGAAALMEDAGAGAFAFVGASSSTSSVSSFNMNGIFTTDYLVYLLIFERVTGAYNANMRFRFVDTSNNALSGSSYNYWVQSTSTNTFATNYATTSYFGIGPGALFHTDNRASLLGTMWVYMPRDTSYYTSLTWTGRAWDSGDVGRNVEGFCTYKSTTAIGGIQLHQSSGSFSNHSVRAYGVANS